VQNITLEKKTSQLKVVIIIIIILASCMIWMDLCHYKLSASFYFGRIRPCVIDSLFQVTWPPEIGACALQTQHKIYFQHSVFLITDLH
jgi:hypothetical protein